MLSKPSATAKKPALQLEDEDFQTQGQIDMFAETTDVVMYDEDLDGYREEGDDQDRELLQRQRSQWDFSKATAIGDETGKPARTSRRRQPMSDALKRHVDLKQIDEVICFSAERESLAHYVDYETEVRRNGQHRP